MKYFRQKKKEVIFLHREFVQQGQSVYLSTAYDTSTNSNGNFMIDKIPPALKKTSHSCGVIGPFQRFFKKFVTSGFLLFCATFVALLCACCSIYSGTGPL